MMVDLIEKIYSFLWGDLVHIPLPGGSTLGISLLIILLIPAGIYFTIRTRFLPIRLFPDMVRALVEKKKDKNSLSSFQALVVSTATRVGMGNLVGVVAAISAGGAGAVFWRAGILYPCLCGRKTKEKKKQSCDFCVICNLRPDLLVWYQPGDQ